MLRNLSVGILQRVDRAVTVISANLDMRGLPYPQKIVLAGMDLTVNDPHVLLTIQKQHRSQISHIRVMKNELIFRTQMKMTTTFTLSTMKLSD